MVKMIVLWVLKIVDIELNINENGVWLVIWLGSVKVIDWKLPIIEAKPLSHHETIRISKKGVL